MNKTTRVGIFAAAFVTLAILSSDARAYYDPQQGRFIARDSFGYVDGLNAYEYVGGRPLRALDPSGNCHVDKVEVMVSTKPTFVDQNANGPGIGPGVATALRWQAKRKEVIDGFSQRHLLKPSDFSNYPNPQTHVDDYGSPIIYSHPNDYHVASFQYAIVATVTPDCAGECFFHLQENLTTRKIPAGLNKFQDDPQQVGRPLWRWEKIDESSQAHAANNLQTMLQQNKKGGMKMVVLTDSPTIVMSPRETGVGERAELTLQIADDDKGTGAKKYKFNFDFEWKDRTQAPKHNVVDQVLQPQP